jgi:hypothetical protein
MVMLVNIVSNFSGKHLVLWFQGVEGCTGDQWRIHFDVFVSLVVSPTLSNLENKMKLNLFESE